MPDSRRFGLLWIFFAFSVIWRLSVFHFLDNGLECCGIVEGEIGEDFAVDFDTALVNQAHELAVREILETGCGVDALNPKRAEVALFVFTVTIGIGEAFFPCVLCYGPDVAAAAIIAAGEF